MSERVQGSTEPTTKSVDPHGENGLRQGRSKVIYLRSLARRVLMFWNIEQIAAEGKETEKGISL